MNVVVALGGSVLSLSHPRHIEETAALIIKASLEIDLYIVVGGGKTARAYVEAARTFCTDERYLDSLGIAATRLNAFLLNTFFRRAIPHTIEEAIDMSPPVIMGGTEPGHSTDAVAAMLARALKPARLLIATDVDGVFDKDPKLSPDAKKLDAINIKQLRMWAGDSWEQAGKSTVIDAVACKIIDEAQIPTYVLNGQHLDQLENAIYGREFYGTIVELE